MKDSKLAPLRTEFDGSESTSALDETAERMMEEAGTKNRQRPTARSIDTEFTEAI